MAKAVYCLAENEMQAERILDELKASGYSSSEVSVLWPDGGDRFGLRTDKATKAPEGAATGAASGGVIGGVLGWLAGIGALAIPGVGPIVAAGPIMGLLSGAAIGATVGGLSGALIGLGIPEYEAKRYEEGLKSGQVLLSCHCRDNDEARTVEELFKRTGGKDISTTKDMSEEELHKKQQKAADKRDDMIDTTPGTDVYPTQRTTDVYRGDDLGRGV